MITVICILDMCSKVEKTVDHRRCSRCKHFTEGKRFGTVQCAHEDAVSNPNKENWQLYKDTLSTAHIFLTGNMRYTEGEFKNG